MADRRLPAVLLLAGSLAALCACGASESAYTVTEVREVARPDPPPPLGLTDAQRLRFVHGDDEDEPGARHWTYATPEGWTELPPAPMRELGWRVPGSPEGECTFAVYEGKAGGLLANVNRWRKQFSLEPTTAEALASLPKGLLLRQQALRIELTGTYVGMAGTRKDEGWALLGLVAEMPMATAFLKFVGPADLVTAQSARFEQLAASLRMDMGSAGAPRAGGPPGGPAGDLPAPPTGEPPFAWSAPEGWQEQPARSMRIVTFVPKAAPGTEVYVSQFPGNVGGVRANVDRWRGEVGMPPISDAEFAALARLKALNVDGTLMSAQGRFSGMSGKPIDDARLLGLIVPRSRDVVFVKMVGPSEEVRGEEERFRAFCGSLRE